MGRPVNKRYFGALNNTSPDQSIRVTADTDGNGAVDGFIVSQRGTKKFRVTTSAGTSVCTVVNKAAGSLAQNEMILFGNAGGTTVRLAKMYNRTCRDFDNNRYKWEVVDDSTSTYLQLTAI
jgi:hypothetical protein